MWIRSSGDGGSVSDYFYLISFFTKIFHFAENRISALGSPCQAISLWAVFSMMQTHLEQDFKSKINDNFLLDW